MGKDSGYDQSFEDFKTGMSSDEDKRKSQLTELHESSGENSIEDAINQLDVTASEPGKTLKDEIIPIIRETGHLNVFLGCPELPPTISSHIQKDQSETATEKEWMDKLNNEEKEKNVAEKFQEEILQSIKTESEKLEEDDEIEKTNLFEKKLEQECLEKLEEEENKAIQEKCWRDHRSRNPA